LAFVFFSARDRSTRIEKILPHATFQHKPRRKFVILFSSGGEVLQVEVFGDLLFLVNFSMDFLTLYLCAKLCFRPLSPWRALLASTLGALYAVAVLFFPPLPTPLALAIDLGFCLLLCTMGLYHKGESPWVVMRLGAIYLLISALLSGLLTFLSSLLNRVIDQQDLVEAVGEENPLFLIFSLLCPAAVGLCLLLCRAHNRAASQRTVTLHIHEGDRHISIQALCDSGNLLREPTSGHPVIPVERALLRPLLPEALWEALLSEHPSAALAGLPIEITRRCRILPARSALGEQMLICFAVERVYVEASPGKCRQIAATIAPVVLRQHARNADYAAIFPTSLLTK
jgi:stage II sporulation protein GA (sporulation sigma-E factor processing peptidase)